MISPTEEVAVQKFLEVVNRARARGGVGPVTWRTGVKFLMARKFDVDRALTLYEQHQRVRLGEGLYDFQPANSPLKDELDSGKFTVLPTRDSCGASIALFTAHLHHPATTNHRDTLRGLVFQLDVALESIEAQRNGLVFIYDMTESKYSNFDYDLSQKILTILKGAYPARLKKVLIVTAPLWFKAPFKILRLFVREKLRDRVWTISLPQLSLHIPESALPERFGGAMQLNHVQWLQHCQQQSMDGRVVEMDAELCDITLSPQPEDGGSMTTSSTSSVTATGAVMDSQGHLAPLSPGDNGKEGDKSATSVSGGLIRIGSPRPLLPGDTANGLGDNEITGGGEVSSAAAAFDATSDGRARKQRSSGDEDGALSTAAASDPLGSESSGFSSDDDSLHVDDGRGLSIAEFLQQLAVRGRNGLYLEYSEIKAADLDGTFCNSLMSSNRSKNRYSDVLCFDHSRVVLTQINDDPTSDYINANYVDGYKQRNAFISTQGPIPTTFADYWRMVWEQRVLLIVMTTRLVEQGRTKCGRYWPLLAGEQTRHGYFIIDNLSVEQAPSYVVTQLLLTDTRTDQTRPVTHYLFTAWPDYNVPHCALAMLRFLTAVRTSQAQRVAQLNPPWTGHPLGPPILIHCSAGIGRTGTFSTLDICVRRLEDVGTVDVAVTVEKVRSQRAHSIQMPDQYVFCHTALVDYAVSRGLVEREEALQVPLMAELAADDSATAADDVIVDLLASE